MSNSINKSYFPLIIVLCAWNHFSKLFVFVGMMSNKNELFRETNSKEGYLFCCTHILLEGSKGWGSKNVIYANITFQLS